MLVEAFWANLLILKIVGLYPVESVGKLYTLYKWLIYWCLTVPMPVLSVVFLIVIDEKNIQVVNDAVFISSQIGCLIIRQLPMILHPKEVKSFLNMLDMSMFTQVLPHQQPILDNCTYVCKRNFRIFFTCCISTQVTWSLRPLFLDIDLPQAMYFPLELVPGTLLYIIVYANQSLCVLNAAMSNAAMDTLMSGLLYQATAQMKILKDNLKNIHTYLADGDDISDNAQKENSNLIYNKIIKYVKHHIKIIEFVTKFEQRFSSILFYQFIASIFVLCFGCLQLISSTPFTYAFFAMIVFMITMTLQIFFYCYYGTLLYLENESLPLAIFSGNWYLLDKKAKAALFNIMERAKRPMRVTAGKVFDVSLETFLMIVRRSYSLLAVLRSYK